MGLLISNRRILGVARAAEKHLKRARSFENIDLFGAYYNKMQREFEQVFEDILNVLEIKFEKLDDKTKNGN